MHENTSIANHPQSNPTALVNEAVHSIPAPLDQGTELNERLPIQLKLSVGAANDPLEQEADAMADKVMRMPETSFIQRCACNERDDEHVRLKPLSSRITPLIQTKTEGAGTVSDSVSGMIKSSKGGGSSMAGETKNFMESRFGADFSAVKIHTGTDAVQMSRELNAQAFTLGSDIYFNQGRYNPSSSDGRHLLAHELTHTLQQGAADTHIARFTDTNHHIIEEAGLAGAGFGEDEIKQIEAGNIKRDYSQLPASLNLLLLCDKSNYGGYHAADHFDNYIWDDKTNAFRDRGAIEAEETGVTSYKPTADPVNQIEENIRVLMSLGRSASGFEHLGNAFHAVEDLFAHSNFIELSQGDYRFGKTLVTGSNDEGAAKIATASTLNAISMPNFPVTSPAYRDNIKKNAPRLSHSQIAKDYASDPNHLEARRLASLVVQELSREIITLLNIPDKKERIKAYESTLFPKIRRYMRPPDPVNDPWWTKLRADDNGAIDVLLQNAEERTPVTVNQCMLSPLVSMESTRNARMRSFGAGNPLVSLGRFVFNPVANLRSNTDLLLGAIPSVSIPFAMRGHKANLTVGGMLFLPPDTSLRPEERDAFTGDADRRKDQNNRVTSGVGISFGVTWK